MFPFLLDRRRENRAPRGLGKRRHIDNPRLPKNVNVTAHGDARRAHNKGEPLPPPAALSLLSPVGERQRRVALITRLLFCYCIVRNKRRVRRRWAPDVGSIVAPFGRSVRRVIDLHRAKRWPVGDVPDARCRARCEIALPLEEKRCLPLIESPSA